MISTWWLALSTFEKVLWSITLAASLIFVIQTILTFVGADTGGDFDMDTDVSGLDADVDASSGMNLYTFRNKQTLFRLVNMRQLVLCILCKNVQFGIINVIYDYHY